jgi:hypothetical protein
MTVFSLEAASGSMHAFSSSSTVSDPWAFRSFLIEAVDVFVCSLMAAMRASCSRSAFAASNLDSDQHKKFRSSELQFTHSDEIMRDHKEYLLAHYSDESVPVQQIFINLENRFIEVSAEISLFPGFAWESQSLMYK